MKRKRIKKYSSGGMSPAFTAGEGFSGTATGQGIGMFGGMAGNAIAQADQADGHMSTGGALGSGALKGAAMGAALGPVGMLIGGGLGAAAGLLQKKKFNEDAAEAERQEQEAERERLRLERQSELQAMDAALENYPVTGTAVPRYSYGGPTNPPTGEQYFAMPNYGGSMDPNAQPSMDFYYGGKQMPAAEFIQHLPQGVNINDVATHGYRESKPTFDPNAGWNYSGQNSYMTDFKNMKSTGSYAMGGETDPVKQDTTSYPRAKTLEELQAAQANAASQGTISQYYPSRWELFKEALHKHNTQDDGTFENAMEMVDPTGISSWDDAYRANIQPSRPYTADQTLDTVGAFPLYGKVKAGLNLGKGTMSALKYGFKQSGEAALKHGKKVSNALNVADGLEDETGVLDGYAMGGDTDPKKESTMGMVRAFGLHPMAKDYADKYPAMRDALGRMGQEEFESFRTKVHALKQNAQGLKGEGIGAALGFVKDADLSFVKPLRESAGFSKSDMVDEILGQTDLGYIGRKGAKAALMMKEFNMGGMTLGPQYEVEGGEMMQYQQGDQPATYGQGGMSQVASQEFEVKGPKHSQGGVQASDNKGARVFSDQLRVDKSLAAKLMKL